MSKHTDICLLEYLCKPLDFLSKVWETHSQAEKGTIIKHPSIAENALTRTWVSGFLVTALLLWSMGLCASHSGASLGLGPYICKLRIRLPDDHKAPSSSESLSYMYLCPAPHTNTLFWEKPIMELILISEQIRFSSKKIFLSISNFYISFHCKFVTSSTEDWIYNFW